MVMIDGKRTKLDAHKLTGHNGAANSNISELEREYTDKIAESDDTNSIGDKIAVFIVGMMLGGGFVLVGYGLLAWQGRL